MKNIRAVITAIAATASAGVVGYGFAPGRSDLHPGLMFFCAGMVLAAGPGLLSLFPPDD